MTRRSANTRLVRSRRTPLPRRARRWLRQRWRDYRWFVIGGLWAVALLTGYIGFAWQSAASGQSRSPLSLLYLTLQLFTMGSGDLPDPINWPLEIARWLAPAVAAYTTLQTLALLFREQADLIRLQFFRNHTVVCGLGRRGLRIAKGFRLRGERVVAIDHNKQSDFIEAARAVGIVVLTGDATQSDLLQQARIRKAKRMIVVCVDDDTNAEVAVRAFPLVAKRKGAPLTCTVHVSTPQLYALLREREILSREVDRIRLAFFNIYDAGARVLLDKFPPFKDDLRSPAHVLIVGLGRMGENVVKYIAKRWSSRQPVSQEHLRVTVVDLDADRKLQSLRWCYPQLDEPCELVGVSMDVRDPEFQKACFLYNAEGCCDVTTIYVCLDNDSLGLSTALTLRHKVREQGIPIVVRTEQDAAGLAWLVAGVQPDGVGGFGLFHAFGLLDQTCTPDLLTDGTHEIIARAIHRSYLLSPAAPPPSVGASTATVPWDELAEEYREQCRRQADCISERLRAIGCYVEPLIDWNAEPLELSSDEICVLARMEHERWLEERRRDGWKRGPRNDRRKRNPYLVPWEQLPDDIKEINDRMVRSLLRSLVEVGLQLYRTNRSG